MFKKLEHIKQRRGRYREDPNQTIVDDIMFEMKHSWMGLRTDQTLQKKKFMNLKTKQLFKMKHTIKDIKILIRA